MGWELDCQKNYVFYKVEDPNKRIRGLWFHDDNERQRIEGLIEQQLKTIRSPPAEPVPSAQAYTGGPPPGVPSQAPSQERVTINMASVRGALTALAQDDDFVSKVYQKLKENAASP